MNRSEKIAHNISLTVSLMVILIFGLIFNVGCSTQNRETTAQITDRELFSLIGEFQSSAVTSLSLSNADQGNATVIFHARQSSSRPATSVFSIDELGFFNSAWAGLGSFEVGLNQVDTIFIDRLLPDTGERIFALLVKMVTVDNPDPVYFTAKSASNSERFTDTDFYVEVTGDNGEVLGLSSTDLSADYAEELATAIKLDVYGANASGAAGYIGQVSTMAGFGNR